MEAIKEQRNTPSRDADAELGKRAHMLIWGAGRKQGDIAAAIGMSSGSLGLKLKGNRGWALAEIIALADVLGTTVAYLVGEAENPTQSPDGNNDHLIRRSEVTEIAPIASLADFRNRKISA